MHGKNIHERVAGTKSNVGLRVHEKNNGGLCVCARARQKYFLYV